MKLSKRLIAAVGAGAVVLALTACSSKSNNTTNAKAASAGQAPNGAIGGLTGVSTTVDLDTSTAMVLQQNKVTVAPVAPATAAAQNGTTAVSFPITAGYVALYPHDQLPFARGILTHSGGLTFSAGGKTLTATDFIVNPGSSVLTGTVGGNSVPLLDLDGSKVQVSNDAQGQVHLDGTVAKLSQQAADALNQTFGVTLFKQGIPLGVVHIVAKGSKGETGGPGALATIESLKGDSTSVDVDPSTAMVLQQNNVTVAPVGPATAAAANGTTTVSFPITAGYVAVYPQNDLPFVRGILTHSGGLTFSAGGKTLTATNFVVNPGTSILTATVGGNAVPLLDLDGSKVKMTTDAQGKVHLDGTVAKLSQTAADALNQTFGVTLFKAGIPLGVVHIVATAG